MPCIKCCEKEMRIQKSAPEYSFYHKVKEFFNEDVDFYVGDIDEDNLTFKITVFNERKFDILKKAFTIPKYAKRLTVHIELSAEPEDRGVSEEDLAFLLEGNKYFSRYLGPEDDNRLIPTMMKYVLMEPVVVQYYDDIFNNPAGLDTKTAEALAKEIFKNSHCNITTDVK